MRRVGSDSLVQQVRREAAVLIALGWPSIAAKLLDFTPQTMLFWLVAPLGPNAVAVAGMGSFWVNVTGQSIVAGFGIGMVPLASQAFGAKNYERMAVLLMRQQSIHLLLSLSVLVLWWNTEAALLALQQPPAIAAGTATFVRWRMLALPFLVINQNCTAFLQCQRVMKPQMWVGIMMNPISIALFWLAINHLDLGTSGAAFALTICDALRACLNAAAVTLKADKRTLPKYCSAGALEQTFNLSGWWELLKISLPGALTVWSEWWAWEVCVVMAGWLCEVGDETTAEPQPTAADCVPLAVQPILGNTMVLGFMAHIGFGIAACSHVGNLLGAGEPRRARITAYTALAIVIAIAAGAALLLYTYRAKWAQAFSPDSDVVAALIVDCLPYICLYIVGDAVGIGVLNFVLRAAGRVLIPGIINFASFYVVGIPLGALLAFGFPAVDLGLSALWIGLDFGMLSLVLGLACYLSRLDWELESRLARARSTKHSPAHVEGSNAENEGDTQQEEVLALLAEDLQKVASSSTKDSAHDAK